MGRKKQAAGSHGKEKHPKTENDPEQNPTTSKDSSVDPFNSNLEKFAFHKQVKHLISRPNIPVTACYFDYIKEFEKFLDFIDGLKEPGKSQLTTAIYPLFVSFYLSMVSEINEAETFYHKFVHIFGSAKDYTDVLKELYEVKSKKNMEEHPYFRNFRVQKYILRISCAVLNELKSFIKGIESKALWSTLSLYFYFEDPVVESLTSSALEKIPKENVEAKQQSEVKELESLEQHLSVSARKDNQAQDTIVENNPNLLQSLEEDLTNDKLLLIRNVFDWCKSDVYTMDFNQDQTEICVTFGEPCIYISPLEEKKISNQFKNLSDSKETSKQDFEYGKRPAISTMNTPDSESQGSLTISVHDITIKSPILIPRNRRHFKRPNLSDKWIHFPAPVYVAKYFPNLPHLLLAVSGIEDIKL